MFLLKKWLKLKLSAAFTSYLGSSANAILVQMKGMKLLVPASDLSFARHLGREKTYNKPLADFLLNEVTEQSSVLFVGTHIGSVLIPVAKKGQNIVGIEANPSTFEILQDNTGGSKVAFEGTSDLLFRVDQSHRIKIPGDRLDTVLKGHKFDLVVMDIEGSEHKALLGMAELLSTCNKIILEILPISLSKVARITPQEFFNALPKQFHRAVPINTPFLEKSYDRKDFLKMYDSIVQQSEMTGADILFTTK